MCHLVLLMPLIGLTVFWVSPINIATPIYLVILVLSFWLLVHDEVGVLASTNGYKENLSQ